MNRDITAGSRRPAWRRRPRGFSDDLAFLSERPDLAAQLAQLLALVAGQALGAATNRRSARQAAAAAERCLTVAVNAAVNALTTAGSNCVPAQRWSSSSASRTDRAS
jgi:uncharacterized membrane protein